MKKIVAFFLIFTLVFNCTLYAEAKVLQVAVEGEKILKKHCLPVENFDPELFTLLDDMEETMKKHGGVGIAAPQIGKNIQVFVVNYKEKTNEYINPQIIEKKGSQLSLEGCLSVPDKFGIVVRPNFVRGYAFDRTGKRFTFEATGDEARIICHEFDHLNGTIFTDIASEVFTSKQLKLKVLKGLLLLPLNLLKKMFFYICELCWAAFGSVSSYLQAGVGKASALK